MAVFKFVPCNKRNKHFKWIPCQHLTCGAIFKQNLRRILLASQLTNRKSHTSPRRLGGVFLWIRYGSGSARNSVRLGGGNLARRGFSTVWEPERSRSAQKASVFVIFIQKNTNKRIFTQKHTHSYTQFKNFYKKSEKNHKNLLIYVKSRGIIYLSKQKKFKTFDQAQHFVSKTGTSIMFSLRKEWYKNDKQRKKKQYSCRTH